MLYIERWKAIFITAVSVLGLLYAAPNMLPPQALGWMERNVPAFLPHQAVNLGLDLRGGSYLLLEVATDVFIKEKTESLLDSVRKELRDKKIGYANLSAEGQTVSFKLTSPDAASAAKTALHDMDRDVTLSTQNEDEISLTYPEAVITAKKRAAIDQSIEIVRRRIDETGTREPSIQRQGENRILVQLPGVDDPQRIKKLLGTTAKLSFRFVDEMASREGPMMGRNLPPGTEKLPLAEAEGQFLIIQKRVIVSGDKLIDAQPSFSNNQPVVNFRFDTIGGKQFGEATRTNVGRLFAIVLDNKIISAPMINEPILGGSGMISGHFTTQSAQDLALLLRAGALPAPIKVLEERTVGPGLGADSIKAGAIACIVGLTLAMLFVLLTYGLFGIFANIALLFNIALIFGILSILQATLTLPGIAGIVLTIGTALDANVLVFERIREEIRLGRTPLSAIDSGYSRALSAIVDANMTTAIAALLLFIFGTGPVKGFAVTLGIGIATSMFSAIMITRLIVVVWTRKTKPKVIPI